MAGTTNNSRILCPSSRCKEGASLLGIVQSNGIVSLATEQIEVTKDFIEIVKLGRKPESRFRFADSCIQSSCNHWKDHKCTLINKVIDVFNKSGTVHPPECHIRNECRWYTQRGNMACAVCPYVITDLDV